MHHLVIGGILKRSTRADCKSAGLRLPRFESFSHHQQKNPDFIGVFCFSWVARALAAVRLLYPVLPRFILAVVNYLYTVPFAVSLNVFKGAVIFSCAGGAVYSPNVYLRPFLRQHLRPRCSTSSRAFGAAASRCRPQPQPSASVGPCASLPSPVTRCRPSAPAVASRRRVPSVVAVSRSASRAAAACDNLRTVRTFEPPRAAAHRVPLGPVSPECRAAGGHRWPVARAGVRPSAPAMLQSALPCACWRCGECAILSVLLTRK